MTRSVRGLLFGFSLAPILALIAAPASAEFYKWTDASGIVHFTANLDEVPPSQRAAASAGSGGKGSFQQIGTGAPAAPAAAPPAAPADAHAPSTDPKRAPQAAATETHGGRTEAQWQAEAVKFRSAIERLEAEAERCKDDEIRWAPGASKRKYDEEQNEAEVCAKARSELDMNRRWLENLEEKAHRAGVPPGWIRD
jgi:hypothetical protein